MKRYKNENLYYICIIYVLYMYYICIIYTYPSCKANSAPCQSINVGLNWFDLKVSYVRHCSFPHPRPNPFKLNRLQQKMIEKKVAWNPKRLKLNQKDATRSPAWANKAPKTAVCKKMPIFHDLWTPLGARLRQSCWKKIDFGSHLEPFGASWGFKSSKNAI